MDLFSRENTQALKGFAAIGILLFHILLAYDITPLFNMFGGLFVAVFLILSGYGLEESYRENGLDGYWHKRLGKVVLPFVFFVCVYNYLYSFLSSGDAMHKCLDELLYISPTFWFVFFILKCYTVYWIGARFMGQRLRLLFYLACALVCLNMEAPCGHLEAEQSFSFLAGVLLSMNKQYLDGLDGRKLRGYTFLLIVLGLLFYCLKAIPLLHDLKGSIAYNYMLCPFRLTTGLAAIPLLTMIRVRECGFLRTAGKYSLEIYIAHIPFIGMITDAVSTAIFLAYSVAGFAIILVYRKFIEKKLDIAQALFIIINVLFVAKYSARVSEKGSLFATLASAVFYYLLLRFVIPYIKEKAYSKPLSRILTAGCLVAFVCMLVMQYAIDPFNVQVDRWSALHFPIQNLLSGTYPYSANTHLGGNASPFPVWQILHIPFYLMGNVGLSLFAAIIFFFWSCRKVQGRQNSLVVSLMLFSSIAVWYEAAVRSDLVTNFLFLAAIINLVFPHLSQEWIEKKMWWITCAVSLLACTRLLTLVPIGILLFPYFIRMNWRKKLAVSLLAIVVFVLTFVPFVLWDWQEFYYFQNNPWALQTRQGNLTDFIIFIPMAIFLALNHKGLEERFYRNAAIMLVSFVVVKFIHNMYQYEEWGLFSSAYDITYFSAALPFCMISCLQNIINQAMEGLKK